ncbi:hypothetical protein IP87_16520 [beta proteobacterium AAP121]|nr:hypothetical protein IP80_00240 [beta proteobacterium AAP65]KPF95538.1 hypothetical protein IP87_16520 [beta proteobacterium AAP121]
MRPLAELGLQLGSRPCVLCGGDAFETLARQDRHLLGLQTVGCTRCGLMQTNPRPDAAGLSAFYAQHYRRLYQGVHDPSDAYVAAYRKDSRLRYTVEHLLRVLRLHDDSLLLDYGCGEGSLFAAFREAGYAGRLAGVEPNPEFARYAAKNGRADVQPEVRTFQALDAVVINHALEHLADPVAVLRDLATRLKPGGYLYLDVPDADRYTHVGDLHLAHILHFTLRTLPVLVRAAGYEVLSCERHDPPHHPLSLRLLARSGPVVAPACTADGEAGTWQHLRDLDARSWRWVWSQRLAPLYRASQWLRSLPRKVLW